MPHRKITTSKRDSPDHEVIAKAEDRFAKADKQRAAIKADPKGEVIRVRRRVHSTKKSDA